MNIGEEGDILFSQVSFILICRYTFAVHPHLMLQVNLSAYVISHIRCAVWAESLHYTSSSFHLGPVSITVCLKLPTVAAVNADPFWLLSLATVLSGR